MVSGRVDGAAGAAFGRFVRPDRDERPVGAVVVGVAPDVLVVLFDDDADAVDAGVLNASQPVIATTPPAPIAPVIRRARRAGCGRWRRGDSMRDTIEPQSHDTLGAGWVSASSTRRVVRPPMAAVATMNAVRSRNVSLSVPAVTPWAVARMNSGKLR